MMNRQLFHLLLTGSVVSSILSAQELRFSVENPSSVARPHEPVVIPWEEVAKKLPGVSPATVQVWKEEGGDVPVQVDDLDLDGSPDELTFASDFSPHQRRVFTLRLHRGETKSGTGSFRTDAGNWKRSGGAFQSIDDDDGPGFKRAQSGYRFDGVGWESELVGYRIYLDERNAVDIQGKRKPGLYWNMIGSSGVDYQQDADWGMDVLHVGPALGVGGIGFWTGDSVLKPVSLDRRRCRIIARGPVRAVVRVDYSGWALGTEKVDVTSLFFIYAGDRVSEHRVILGSTSSPRTIVTGIVKHPSAKGVWKAEEAWLSTQGTQSRANDELMMALNFEKSAVVQQTEDEFSHLVLLKLGPQKPLRFLISSVWRGETGSMWAGDQIELFLRQVGRRLNEPLKVGLM
ncbi:MAG: DUF4861 domain-containing protein [Ignavibacteriales bacterium]|nr:DUF4861 domain-containing protein [Ignavibacteriales bacterium]